MTNEGDIIRTNRKAMEEATVVFLKSLPTSNYRYDMAQIVATSTLAQGNSVGDDLESILAEILDNAEVDAALQARWLRNRGSIGKPEDYERNARIIEHLKAGASWSTIQKLEECSRDTVARLARRMKAA